MRGWKEDGQVLMVGLDKGMLEGWGRWGDMKAAGCGQGTQMWGDDWI